MCFVFVFNNIRWIVLFNFFIFEKDKIILSEFLVEKIVIVVVFVSSYCFDNKIVGFFVSGIYCSMVNFNNKERFMYVNYLKIGNKIFIFLRFFFFED